MTARDLQAPPTTPPSTTIQERRLTSLADEINRLQTTVGRNYTEVTSKLSIMVKASKHEALANDFRKLQEAHNKMFSELEDKLAIEVNRMPTTDDVRQLWEKYAELDEKINTTISISFPERDRIAMLESDVKQLRQTLDDRCQEFMNSRNRGTSEFEDPVGKEDHLPSLADGVQHFHLDGKFAEFTHDLELTSNVLPFKIVEEDVRRVCAEVIVGKMEALTQDLTKQAEKSKNDNNHLQESIDNLAHQMHDISGTWRTQVADMIADSITEVQEDIAKKNEEISVKLAEFCESIDSRTKNFALASDQFNEQRDLSTQDSSSSCDAQAHVNPLANADVDTKAKGPWTFVSAYFEHHQEAPSMQTNKIHTEDSLELPVKRTKPEGSMCKRKLQQLRLLVNSSLCKSFDGEVRTCVLGSTKGETRAANVNRSTLNATVDAAKLRKMGSLVHVMLHGKSCLSADDDPSELGTPKAIDTDLPDGRMCTNFDD